MLPPANDDLQRRRWGWQQTFRLVSRRGNNRGHVAEHCPSCRRLRLHRRGVGRYSPKRSRASCGLQLLRHGRHLGLLRHCLAGRQDPPFVPVGVLVSSVDRCPAGDAGPASTLGGHQDVAGSGEGTCSTRKGESRRPMETVLQRTRPSLSLGIAGRDCRDGETEIAPTHQYTQGGLRRPWGPIPQPLRGRFTACPAYQSTAPVPATAPPRDTPARARGSRGRTPSTSSRGACRGPRRCS